MVMACNSLPMLTQHFRVLSWLRRATIQQRNSGILLLTLKIVSLIMGTYQASTPGQVVAVSVQARVAPRMKSAACLLNCRTVVIGIFPAGTSSKVIETRFLTFQAFVLKYENKSKVRRLGKIFRSRSRVMTWQS